jgi:signal peptidase I
MIPFFKKASINNFYTYMQAQILLFFTVLFVTVVLFSFRIFIVTGESMESTYSHNQYVIAENITPRLLGIARGDILVFTNPHTKTEVTMKRVIGLPNEQVSIKDSEIIIQKAQGAEVFGADTLIGGGTTGRNGSAFDIVLGPEDYFVLGDNRSKSTDSREWGAVQMVDVMGKVRI